MKNSIPNVGTSSKPAAVIYPDGKSVFLAWKGEGNDEGIYWTKTHELAPNAATGKYKFNAQTQVGNVATTHGPALASYKGQVYMAWKGESGDKAIYWSYYDGSNWQPQTKTKALTDIAPALVATKDAIFLIWQGTTDKKIWWAIMGDAFDGSNNFTVAGALKVGNTFFETSATPSLTADGSTVYMAWKGASTGTLYWAKCEENLQSVVTGNPPQAEGVNAWGNYSWGDQKSIPPYQNDASEASIPGVTIGEITGTGAGPTISGPALIYIRGTYSSGLYLAWVAPALNVNTAEWGPSYPYLSFAFINRDSTNWVAADNLNDGDSADLQPTFISVFEPYTGGINSPIYFFKGIGDDWNIYYNAYLMFDSFQPSPHVTVAGGSFPPGYTPSGAGAVPAEG